RELFTFIKNAILDSEVIPCTLRPELSPAVLFCTEAQYDELPRAFDRIAGLSTKIVTDHEAGWEAILALAREEGIVASPRRFPSLSRWLAFDFELGRSNLRCEPKGWQERLTKTGALAPPEVAHDLEALGVDAKERRGTPEQPLWQRYLIEQL